MENKKQYIKLKILSIAEQLAKIKYDYANFEGEIKNNSTMIAIGNIQPTSLSNVYNVKVVYKLGSRPSVYILSPNINISEYKIPHTYKDNELCLFYPKYKEWTKYEYIADKIIPWISEWLYFYEVWTITGEWKGGGKHPTNNKRKSNKVDKYIN